MKCLHGPFHSGNSSKHNRVLRIQHPTGSTGFYKIIRDFVHLYNVHKAYRTSSIKQHLSARTNCRELYSDNVFSILSRGRCALHLAVLDPELCVQKENVLSAQLFGVTPRRGVNNVT